MVRTCSPGWYKVVAMMALLLLPAPGAFAWGNKGHQMINRMAWQRLPTGMPAFLRQRSVGATLEYLGPEPDRWRSSAEPELSAEQGPEHYIDLEWADRLGELPRARWQFVRELYGYGARHPEVAAEMVPEKVGMQPWQATEIEERLQAAFRLWRTEAAQHRSTAATEQTIVFYMGWLGHYVADGSQPLHTTYRFNGWVGPNPNHYATERGIHSRFETDFVNEAIREGQVDALVRSPQPLRDVFADYVTYLRASNGLVERTYQLDTAGAFTGQGSAEGRQFAAERIAAAVTMLDGMWLTAWENSARPVADVY